jgi:hypothetical protein
MSSPAIALAAIKRAVRAGAWRTDPHLLKRLPQRQLCIADVLAALRCADSAVPHDMRPLNAGGESWRVHGRDADCRRLGVGVELVREPRGGFVVIITAFLEEGER